MPYYPSELGEARSEIPAVRPEIYDYTAGLMGSTVLFQRTRIGDSYTYQYVSKHKDKFGYILMDRRCLHLGTELYMHQRELLRSESKACPLCNTKYK